VAFLTSSDNTISSPLSFLILFSAKLFYLGLKYAINASWKQAPINEAFLCIITLYNITTVLCGGNEQLAAFLRQVICDFSLSVFDCNV